MRLLDLKDFIEFVDWLDNGTRSAASWRTEVRKFKQSLKFPGVEIKIEEGESAEITGDGSASPLPPYDSKEYMERVKAAGQASRNLLDVERQVCQKCKDK